MYDIENRLIKHFTPIIEELQGMDEAEVEAFFLKRENETLRKHNESVKSKVTQEQQTVASQRKTAEYRETHGVSENDYRLAEQDLKNAGVKELSPEAVVLQHLNYVAVEKADSILGEVGAEFAQNDDLVGQVARFLIEEPGLSRVEIVAELKKELLGGVKKSNELEDLTSKVNSKMIEKQIPRQPTKEASTKFESFDDYENELYGFNN